MVSASIVTLLIFSIACLFVSMVLSWMAYSDVTTGNLEDAQKWSKWSAVSSFIAVGLLVTVLLLYIFRVKILKPIYHKIGTYLPPDAKAANNIEMKPLAVKPILAPAAPAPPAAPTRR